MMQISPVKWFSHLIRWSDAGKLSRWRWWWIFSCLSQPSSVGSASHPVVKIRIPCTSFQNLLMSMDHLQSNKQNYFLELKCTKNYIKLPTFGFFQNNWWLCDHWSYRELKLFCFCCKTNLLPAEKMKYLTQTINFWFIISLWNKT